MNTPTLDINRGWTAEDVAAVNEAKRLSATEREQQRVSYIAAVDGMATTLRMAVEAHDSLLRQHQETQRRLDALERGAAVLSAWIHRPLSQRVRERIAPWWVRMVAR